MFLLKVISDGKKFSEFKQLGIEIYLILHSFRKGLITLKYAIGIDLGTSGTKTVLFDETGNVICSATAEYPMYQPQNGYAEQEPADWYNASISTIKTVVSKSGIDVGDIAGIGLSGQMHGLVMLDENNDVIRRSIIWCDQRTARECEEITEKVGAKRLVEITANPALTGFTASKILWVRNNEPDNYARCRHILLPKDYIRFMLTGVYATEVSDASGTLLLDVSKRAWSNSAALSNCERTRVCTELVSAASRKRSTSCWRKPSIA